MVDIPISLLPDGRSIQSKTAEITIEQDGVSYRITTAPTPKMLLYVINQTQLESHFPDGSGGILIPDNESWTIIVTEDFTLSKPIKIGLNSTLEIIGGAVNVIITYTGTGAMIQNENAANPITILRVENLVFTSVGSEAIFDIVCNSLFRINNCIVLEFESLGIIKAGFVEITTFGVFDIQKGIVFDSPNAITTDNFSYAPTSFPVLNLITILTFGGTTNAKIEGSFMFNPNANFIYCDRNSSLDSTFIIKDNSGLFSNLFVQGVIFTVGSVTNFGGQARFNAGAIHGFIAFETYVVNSNFSEPTYNKTGLVGSTPTGSEYMIPDTIFVSDVPGNVTARSLNNTDVQVLAENNSNTPDSAHSGTAYLQVVNPVIVTIDNQDEPKPIVSTSWATADLERISEDTVTLNEGRLVIDDPVEKTYRITYSATIEKSGGAGGDELGIVLLKNGVQVGNNPPRNFTNSIIPLTRTENIKAIAGDVFQVAPINYAGTANIDVYQSNLSMVAVV